MTGALEVTLVARAAGIPAQAWQTCFPPPLEGRFWYETLEESRLEDQFEIFYAHVTRGGATAAIAPCFIHNVPMSLVAPTAVAAVLSTLSRVFPSAGYQRTLFVGSPCSDEGTIGVAPGTVLADVVAALRPHLEARARAARAPMLVFKDVPGASLAAITASPGLVVTHSYPGTVVRLPPGGKQAYLSALSHTHRHNLLKKLRRSASLLDLAVEVVSSPDGAQLDEILPLFLQTYERGRTKFERLGAPFFRAVARHPEARLILLRERRGGALVAFMLTFTLGRRMINKFIGLDYGQDPRASLYFRLFDAALDEAYRSGAAELQSGQTGYRAKLDLGHDLVPLYNVFRHHNPVVHALFRTIGTRIGWSSLDPDLASWLRAHPERDHPLPAAGTRR